LDKVLFVDDEKLLVLSIEKYFAKYNNLFELYTAYNGKEAINILESNKINLVVTDLKMPVMDGFELIAFIIKNFPTIQIIILSGYIDTKILKKTKTMNSIKILEKPFIFETLLKIIVDNLNQRNENSINYY